MLCSGKTHCEIPVSNVVAAGIHPCPVTVMSYLTTSYKCVTGKSLFYHIHYIINISKIII